jgi:chromosome partitioning protein
MLKDIAVVINQKGGVGKSSTVHALGAGLVIKGHRVLFVDLDCQANLSYVLNADMQNLSVLDLLMRKAKINEVIQCNGNADIVVSTPMLAGADNMLTATGKEYRLKESLDVVKQEYDYIIIDTPPSLGILTINALTAASTAIIPAQADVFSLQGIAQVSESIGTVRQYCNNALRIGGILLTRYNPRTIIGRDIAAALENKAKDLNTKLFGTAIRESIAIKEAQASRQDIYQYDPLSNGAVDYKAFVEEYMKETLDDQERL